MNIPIEDELKDFLKAVEDCQDDFNFATAVWQDFIYKKQRPEYGHHQIIANAFQDIARR